MKPPADQRLDSGGFNASLRRLLSPTVVLLLLVVVGYCGLALFPRLRQQLGLGTERMWFMDSYAVLASSDAVRVGLDPAQPNPLDVLHRPHSYTGWWFRLGDLGFTREDNFLVGGSWVLLFFAAAFMLLRPRSQAEAAWALLFLLAPPVQLAVFRANNELVVFALLGLGLFGLRAAAWWQLGLYSLAVVLATGLKFYPLVAAAGLVAVAPARLRWWAFGAALAAAALVLASQWEYFRRAVFPVPTAVFTYGAGVWWRELGGTGRWVTVVSGGLLFLAALFCHRRGWTPGDLGSGTAPPAERVAFVAGATLLVVCWLSGISFAYRWVFALLLLPWLWRERSQHRMVRVALGLLAVCVWADGIYCLATNVIIGPMAESTLKHAQQVWLLVSQPFTWALMALLAGWLWGLVVLRAKELAASGRGSVPGS